YVFDQAKHVRPGMPGDKWGELRENLNGRKLTELITPDLDLQEVMPPGYHRPNNPDDDSWSTSDTSFGGYWAGGRHWSEVLKDDGLEFIADASQSEKPFFMYLAFNAPHDPRQAPQEFLDMYSLNDIGVPPNYLPVYPWKDSIGNSPGLRDEALAPFPRTEFAVKTHIKEYYAIISHLDQQIGEILDALKASGKMDNTYIFFSADHGLAVGQHGLIGKQSMFDHSMRVPLIVTGPGIPAGKKINHDVYLQDIMPTALELAKIEKPDYVFFNSFLDQATGKNQKGNYAAIYGAYRNLQRMIRKDGYKLIVYPKINKVLLFDMEDDPWEKQDLAELPEHQDRVRHLFEELVELQKEMEDELDLSAVYGELF
ncbi:MAG: sulfatase-like hydrolase/transferase, partial [Bacteroidetes bacterium]|nr:sulfatase-like hydrolase/transferase [Bacteroidota bacterium]